VKHAMLPPPHTLHMPGMHTMHKHMQLMHSSNKAGANTRVLVHAAAACKPTYACWYWESILSSHCLLLELSDSTFSTSCVKVNQLWSKQPPSWWQSSLHNLHMQHAKLSI
jgi:hypothetical protein